MTGTRELARVDRAEAYWLPNGGSASGTLMLIAHGVKQTSGHIVDIVPLQPDTTSFAVVSTQQSEFFISQELPFTYSATFSQPEATDQITVLYGGSGNGQQKKIDVVRLEPNSFRSAASQGSIAPFRIAAAPIVLEGPPSFPAAFGQVLPLAGAKPSMNLTSSNLVGMSSFGAEVKFWAAGYSQMEASFQAGGQHWVFNGRGGAFPGGGAFTGQITTNDVNAMLTYTTSCALATVLAYGTVAFFNAAGNVIGNFEGGGMGVGGGAYTGRWQVG